MGKNKNDVAAIETTPENFSVLGMEIDPAIIKAFDDSKPEEFVEVAGDVWKGSDDEPIFLGVLVGKEKSAFESDNGTVAHWWHFVTRNRMDGKPMARRILGSTILERAFAQIDPGTVVQVEYKGKDKTQAGQPVTLYSVKVPKKK